MNLKINNSPSFKGTCTIAHEAQLVKRFPELAEHFARLREIVKPKVINVQLSAHSLKNGYPPDHQFHKRSLKGAKSLQDIIFHSTISYPHRPIRPRHCDVNGSNLIGLMA